MKTDKLTKQSNNGRPITVMYIIGRYPELTTTFIEREIEMLRQLGGFEIHPISIRYPLTTRTIAPEHQSIRDNTIYLVPKNWSDFNFMVFIVGNLRFIFQQPLIYFGTLLYLLVHDHPTLKDRLMTILHFWQGVYAAHILRRREFDHIHAHFIDRAAVVALVIGRLLGKPYSLTAHANNIFAKKILIREKIENAKFMVTVSQYNKSYLLSNYPGLEPGKIHVLHPWVDVSRFVPPPDRPSHSKLHIFSVGRLVEKKGHRYLIEACHRLKKQGLEFECRIVGTGPLKSDLETLITKYALTEKVQLMGGQPQTTVMKLLSSWADLFVLPCVIAKDGDRDGIPVALAEAMAMELPVISTNIVGISELVQSGSGILVPPHDPAALAEALQEICRQNGRCRSEMGQKGREVVVSEFNLLKGTMELARLFGKNAHSQ